MKEADIKVGQSYSCKRWKGDRKVTAIQDERKVRVVHYIDLRTYRTGNSPLELFSKNATGFGQVANI